MRMKTVELTRGGLVATVAVFAVAAVCIRLGLWQLDRRDARLEQNAAIASRLEAPPLRLERVPTDTTGLLYRQVVLRGTADPARTIVLAGRSHRGSPGVHVYTPVRTARGGVLVNRGWLPAPDAATADLTAVRLEGPLRIRGVTMPFPDIDVVDDTAGFRTTWYRFDPGAIRSQYPYPVAPFYIQATETPSPAPLEEPSGSAPGAGDPTSATTTAGSDAAAPLPLDPPALDPGPHLSYAVQWFSFAGIFLIGWLVLLLHRGRSGGTVAGPVDRGGHHPDLRDQHLRPGRRRRAHAHRDRRSVVGGDKG